MHKYLEHEGVLAFAHRGGLDVAPENTMAAFADAVSLGYRYLETDAYVTCDGYVLAFHDDVLDRVSDKSGKIAEMTWSEVSKAMVDGIEPIPLLEDLIMTWSDVCVNVDLKCSASFEGVSAILERTQAFDRVCVGSFDHDRVVAIRERFGEKLCTAFTFPEIQALVLDEPSDFQGDCLQVPVEFEGIRVVSEDLLRKSQDLGAQVHVWTVNEVNEMEELCDLGVDGLITDNLRDLKTVLKNKGKWQ